jgi:hypothetical protein
VITASVFSAAASAQTATPPPAAAAPTPARAPRPASPAPPSKEARAEGKALFAKVVENLGGKEKASKVRDVQTKGQVTAKTAEGEMTMDIQTAMIFPDHLSQQIDAPFGRVAMVATPAGAFLVGATGSQDLPPAMRDELLKQVQRVPLYLAQKVDDPKLTVVADGGEKIGEVEARIVDVQYGSALVRWSVDPKSGRILRSAHRAIGPDGKESTIVADYSDFRTVGGFPIAHHLEVTTNGERDQTLTLEECKINAGVEASLFEKPPPPPAAPTPAPEAK